MSLGLRFRALSAGQTALAAIFLSRAFGGWVIALPLIGVVAGSGVGRLPGGDRALFEPGAMFLLELLRQKEGALSGALRASLILALIALILRTLPLTFLFCALSDPERSPSGLVQKCWRLSPRYLGIAIGESVGIAIGAGAGVGLGLWVAGLEGNAFFGEIRGGLGLLLGLLCSALAAASSRLLGTVARSLSALDPRARRLFSRALRVVRSGLLELGGAYLLAAGAGALLISVGARLAEILDVGRAAGWRVAVVGAVHLCVVLGLSLLEAFWASRAHTLCAQAKLGSPRTRR